MQENIIKMIGRSIEEKNLNELKVTLSLLSDQCAEPVTISIIEPLFAFEFEPGLRYVLSREFASDCPNINLPHLSGADVFDVFVETLKQEYFDCARLLLLNHNVPLTVVDQDGDNLIHLLIHITNSTRSLSWLLSEEFQQEFPNLSLPDINHVNMNGLKPLKLSQLVGKPEFTEVLLSSGPLHHIDYDCNGSHSSNGPVIYECRRLKSNALTRGKAVYLMGVIAWHDDISDDVSVFLQQHGAIIRQQDGYIILSGDIKLERTACVEFLERKYQNIVDAYIIQASEVLRRQSRAQDANCLGVLHALCEAALSYDMSSRQKIKIYRLLGMFYYLDNNQHHKALGWFIKANVLSQLPECADLFTEEDRARMVECEQAVMAQRVELIIPNRIIAAGSVTVSPHSLNLEGRINFRNIFCRAGDKDTPEIHFFRQHGVKIQVVDGVMVSEGPFRAIGVDHILEFMIGKHGSFDQYCINEAKVCFDEYQKEKNSSELEDAEVLLECCLYLPNDHSNKAIALFYLGNVALLRGEVYIALGFYKKAMSLLENKSVDYDDILGDIHYFEHMAQVIFQLQQDAQLSNNQIKKLCVNYKYLTTIHSAIRALQHADVATPENISKIMTAPESALWIAEQCGGRPTGDDNIARDFVRVRSISRVVMQGSRQSSSVFFQLPEELSVNILARCSDNALSKKAATDTVLQALAVTDDVEGNHLAY